MSNVSVYPDPFANGPRDPYDAQPPLTRTQRVANTFIAPSSTFADLRRDRSWWLAFVILAGFAYLFTLTALSHVGAPRLAESAIRNNPAQNERLQQASPEQRAQTLRITATFMQVSFYSWPVLLLLLTAIGAGLLWVGFNFMLGGTASFAGMFAVMMFAWLPSIIRSMLSTLMLFLGDPEGFNINDPVGTNPGFYMAPDSSPFLKTLLSSIDIFTIWTLVLMALGAAIVARVKIRSGIILVFAAWFIVVLARAAIAAAMS